MKSMKTASAILLGALMLSPNLAQAGYIDFTTDQNPFDKSTYTFENVLGEIDLTVAAALWKGTEIADDTHEIVDINDTSHEDARFLERDEDGYGIKGYEADTGGKIDGNGGNDLLILNFSETVSFTGIDFSNFSSNGSDDFEFGIVNVSESGEFLSFTRLFKQADVLDFVRFDQAVTGQTFGIGAFKDDDSFRVAGITAVPEPTALAGFMLAVLAMGLRIRKSR